jgi:integrase
MNLTKAKIDAFQFEGRSLASGTSRDVRWDDKIKGLGLRVYPTGEKQFVLSYRIKGRKRLITIGKFGDPLTLDMARSKATRLKSGLLDGKDPLRYRQDERGAPTVTELANRYLREHARKNKRPRSCRDDELMLKNIVKPRLGTRKVVDITFSDIDAIHRAMKATPYRANRVVALMSKMFSLASTQWRDIYRLDHNPTKGLKRYQEEKRRQYLGTEGLASLTEALNEHADQSLANAVRLLILTGARRGEVLNATWDQFDLEAGVWVKPSSHTKQKLVHQVPLSAPVRELLVGMKGSSASRYLFPSPTSGDKPATEVKRFWAEICKAASFENVRMHDLRHTFASLLASSGHSLPLIGALLGHTQAATTQRYSHLYDDPLREATDRIGELVDAVSNGRSAEVVELNPSKG